jgi:hypothetical protein
MNVILDRARAVRRMVAVWRVFWGDLNEPDSFPAQPYVAGANQVSHIAMAAAASAAVVRRLGRVAWARCPSDGMSVIGLTLAYLLVIEIGRQGWRRGDTPVDTAFFALGAGWPLVSLYEIRFDPRIELGVNKGAFALWSAGVLDRARPPISRRASSASMGRAK